MRKTYLVTKQKTPAQRKHSGRAYAADQRGGGGGCVHNEGRQAEGTRATMALFQSTRHRKRTTHENGRHSCLCAFLLSLFDVGPAPLLYYTTRGQTPHSLHRPALPQAPPSASCEAAAHTHAHVTAMCAGSVTGARPLPQALPPPYPVRRWRPAMFLGMTLTLPTKWAVGSRRDTLGSRTRTAHHTDGTSVCAAAGGTDAAPPPLLPQDLTADISSGTASHWPPCATGARPCRDQRWLGIGRDRGRGAARLPLQREWV